MTTQPTANQPTATLIDPFPLDATPSRPARGCGTVALAGCALVFILVAIAGIGIAFKADELFSWAFDRIGDELEGRISDDTDPALRARLRTALAAFSEAVLAGKVSPDALSHAQQRLTEASRAPRLSAEAVERLCEALEGAVASQAAPDESESLPEPDSEPGT